MAGWDSEKDVFLKRSPKDFFFLLKKPHFSGGVNCLAKKREEDKKRKAHTIQTVIVQIGLVMLYRNTYAAQTNTRNRVTREYLPVSEYP